MSKTNAQFKDDVIKGLTSYPKHLPSKYIYDEKGDKLFQRIMDMPEYYLTNCEFAILDIHKKELSELFAKDGHFDLIELGAGDGKKTKILLKELVENSKQFTYLPIDISINSLTNLKASLAEEIPEVDIQIMQGTYFEVLHHIATLRDRKKVILLLGSNIGNLLHPKAIDFLKTIRNNMEKEDMLFIGFDQKKNPQTILDAYNDPSGITAAFNKNLLHRINSTFNANFDADNFLHWETYNPETGTAMSYLVSKMEQTVDIKDFGIQVDFNQWETIHVEISQKYDDKIVQWLAEQSGLCAVNSFADTKMYYKNYIFKKDELV